MARCLADLVTTLRAETGVGCWEGPASPTYTRGEYTVVTTIGSFPLGSEAGTTTSWSRGTASSTT